ncbi:MAG: hypothetical protein CVV24_15365 [Ignavibacteriae bacterium HGW-Ignavibacteriae-3]|nr:MAG: hypothetical protein CVV24_15365 [Ignavibacteriae bacterium HGW-Ignavibacteriae-3]
MKPKIRILIVEDERLIAEDLREMLSGMGHEIIGISKTGESAITFSAEHDPDLILMDIHLSEEMDGITAAEQIKIRKDIPIIFLTAFASEEIVSRAKYIKPSGYILKPYSEEQIRTSIEIAIYIHNIDRQLKERDAIIQMMINTTEDAMMIFDSSGTIQFVNEVIAMKAGKKADNVIGTRIEDLKPTGIFSESVSELLALARIERPITVEEQVGDNWYECSSIPVRNSDGKVTHIGYYCHDITFHKQIEQGLHDTVNHLIQERRKLEQTREDLHRVNEELQTQNKTRSAELASIQKSMAKNQLLLKLVNTGDIALKEDLDEPGFLQKICTQIISERKYPESWIVSTHPSGKPIHVGMSNQNPLNLSDFIGDDRSLKYCPALGIKNILFFKAGGETCKSCPLREICGNRYVITGPILYENQLLGVAGAIVHSEEPLSEQEEIPAFIDISASIGFALQYVRSSDREKQAFQQISKNIEMLSILNDKIRNPLSIIMGLTEMDGGNSQNNIIDQVRRIDEVIDNLDCGFLESIKVYDYLKKHHGFKPDKMDT